MVFNEAQNHELRVERDSYKVGEGYNDWELNDWHTPRLRTATTPGSKERVKKDDERKQNQKLKEKALVRETLVYVQRREITEGEQ